MWGQWRVGRSRPRQTCQGEGQGDGQGERHFALLSGLSCITQDHSQGARWRDRRTEGSDS